MAPKRPSLPSRSWQGGGRYFAAKKTVKPGLAPGTEAPSEPFQQQEYELPLPSNQSIAAAPTTVTARESIRGFISEVYVDIPRQMAATLWLDEKVIVTVADKQGSTGIRQLGKTFVVNARASFTNQKGTAQNAKFILRST